MADGLEILRPEVRRADSFLDSMACSADEEAAVKTIRAELLRLAKESESLTSQAFEWKGRAEKAEAELAALKARIAETPVYEIPLSKPKSEDGWIRVIESVKNERSVRGKRVRLIVEE